jgi:4-diphosphocytidyl-2-C-methyl-D-erythritol kinase
LCSIVAKIVYFFDKKGGFFKKYLYVCSMILHANCKINLGLDILRRREDGFHDLETVMVPVRDLYDIVEVERVEGSSTFEQQGLTVDCNAEDNLCMKALRLMQRLYGVGEAYIRLEKRIPFGAGLGGGSSDATAVILAIDKIYGLGLSEDRLVEIAAMIGSDTAFFVRNTPQLCTGRGERMQPIDLPIKGLYLAIAKPNEGVSTKEAYAGVKPAAPQLRLVDALRRPLNEWQGCVKNDFEPHIFEAHPAIAALKQKMLDEGALYASMSGSGSAVFGLFADEPQIELSNDNYLKITKL